MAPHWYALRTKPRKEDAVWKQAGDQGFEVFYPILRVNPVNPRARKFRPYFPSYLFIQADLVATGQSVLQWMPYSQGLVCFGGEPAVVPDNLIVAIKKRLEEISVAGGENLEGIQKGGNIQVIYGPFKGYQGIFDARLPGSERVRVLLQLLDSRRVPVELSASNIKAEEKRGTHG
jgi:transcription antitermination factor NusG